MNQIKSNPSKTILTICVGFMMMFIILKSVVFLYTSLTLGLIGITSKFISEKIEKGWFKIGELLGYIVPNIILSVIFYLILFPISIIAKIFKKDDLLKLKNNKETTFIEVDKKFDPDYFKKPF
jgi:hypothetical protein